MSLKKQYLKGKTVCRVTFEIPVEQAEKAKSISIVGDFNNWDKEANPMKHLKNGSFQATIDLMQELEYEFRYLLDETQWENDWEADKYKPSPMGNWDNSVVVT